MQARASNAAHAKLDELLRASHGAQIEFVGLDNHSDTHVQAVREYYHPAAEVRDASADFQRRGEYFADLPRQI